MPYNDYGEISLSAQKEHLEYVKHIAGYLSKYKDAALKFNVREPDYGHLTEMQADWTYSVYMEM